jgi:phosphoribosyl 1,2-cyclic phosphate phosphodiesterase
MQMQVKFLGTGTSQGVPVIACDCAVCQSPDAFDARLRSSVLVEAKGKHIIIDTGPDFRTQMLRAKVQNLDAVLFTHEHRDHLAGLDDIRAFNHKQNKAMPIYSEKRVLDIIKQEFAYAFQAGSHAGLPQMQCHEILPNQTFQIDDLAILPLRAMHGTLPILGYKIGDFTYLTDVKELPFTTKEAIQNTKILVINALRIQEHPTHFNLAEALACIAEIKPQKAYITHISHLLGKHQDVQKQLPANVFLAHDQLDIHL